LAKIVVVGSSNTDMVVMTPKIPAPGETVIGGNFMMAGGGKGANQAFAATRLCADVTFIARVGMDMFGEQAIENLKRDGIRTDYISRDNEAPSGVALIFVDKNAENIIAVAPGANDRLSSEHILQAQEAIEVADVVIMQLEIPIKTVEVAAKIAHESGTKVILNPAPAQDLPLSLLKMVDVLTPNETEAALLTGLPSTDGIRPEEAGKKLLDLGVGAVVMTLGAKGALIVTKDYIKNVTAPKVDAVDTTAAGDAFNGALAVALAEGSDLEAAVKFAVNAAALSVTKIGAQPSLATRSEVDEFIG
jgi:ribokinase